MIRSMAAIFAGYLSITVLNSFTHLIITIYFKTELTFAGVANLPAPEWVFGITVLQLVFGLFGGLLATTIAPNPKKVILGLILVMVAIGLVDYSVIGDREPLWYLITAPAFKILGILSGYRLQMKQLTKTSAA